MQVVENFIKKYWLKHLILIAGLIIMAYLSFKFVLVEFVFLDFALVLAYVYILNRDVERAMQ